MNMGRITVPVTESKIKVQQHMAEQTDIRFIMKRYRETGVLASGKASGRQPMYFDVSELPQDYAAAVAMVESAKKRFGALPVEVRQKFNYDPKKMLEFIQTGSREEAEELGIIEKKKSGKMPENPPEKGEPHSDPLDVRVRSDTKKEKGVKKTTTTVVEEQ